MHIALFSVQSRENSHTAFDKHNIIYLQMNTWCVILVQKYELHDSQKCKHIQQHI